MTVITNLIIFILMLGAIVCIHEFGHFLFAKLTGVYVYEFSIGMGPKIFGKKDKKNETEYCIRLIPIGGFVQLAGEEIEDDKKIPKERKLQTKKPWQRFLIMFFGAGFNFISAFIIILAVALIWGYATYTPIISNTTKEDPAYIAGLRKGDKILEIDGHKISTLDDASLYLTVSDKTKAAKIKVKTKDNSIKTYNVKPKKIKVKKETTYKYGIEFKSEKRTGFLGSIKYTFVKTKSLFRQMFVTIEYLFTGKVKLSQMSGPVGIYQIVGTQAESGISSLLFLMAYLSINVGFINLLPLPAFDGGHILFILIEMIRRKPVKREIENIIHSIGMYLLMALMIYITINDIIKLF